MNFAALVKEAMVEVVHKTSAAIEQETAYKWAARAVACIEYETKATDEANERAIATWRRRFYDYEHEALEHAAMVKDGGRTLADIEDLLHQAYIGG